METNIAKTQNTEIAKAQAPRRGFEEETSREDLIIPRVKLLQPLSPEVVEKPKEFQGGLLINSLTLEVLPEYFIPIFKFTNWIRWNPRDANKPGFHPDFPPGEMLWRSDDPFDPRVQDEGKFGPNGEPPLATKFLNFFSIFPGVPMPIIVSFSKTSFKAGKQLMSLAQFSQGDMFSKKYKLSSKLEKNDQYSFWVLTVEQAGKASDEEYAQAEGLWKEFHSKKIKVHDEEQEEIIKTEEEDAPF